MDHLNLFAPFEGKDNSHEDVLTRNFLILVKNIPLVQVGFFELIRSTMWEKGVKIDSIAQGKLKLSEIYTQVDINNENYQAISDGQMLSVIISDDLFKEKHTVKNSNRHARYDGLILCEPSWVFIIENKPSAANIWKNQLNPNFDEETNISLIPEPCAISWRTIISLLNELCSSNMLAPLENTVIVEFLEYVNSEYSELNPYDRFCLCNSNKFLLDRRCCDIMRTYSADIEVKYRKGGRHYIDVGNKCIQQIALGSEGKDSWRISLWMYAGDIMSSARKTYDSLNVEKLLSLKNKPGFFLESNLHFSHIRKGKLWLDCPPQLQFEEYIRYWINRRINQLKEGQYMDCFHALVEDGIVRDTDEEVFKEAIDSKNYQTVNVCPGFLIKYTWEQNDAIRLDNQGAFEKEFRRIVDEVLDIFD